MSDVTGIHVLRSFYEAETDYLRSESRDFAVLASTLHPDCVMYQPDSLPYGGRWYGHDGYEQWMEAFGEAWSTLTVNHPEFFPSGPDRIFVRSTVMATARASRIELSWPLLQMITVKDELLLEIQPFYWDTAPIVNALRR